MLMNWTSDLQILRHRTSVKKCRGMHHLSYGQRGVPTKTMERFLITRWGSQHHVSRSKELEVHGVTDWKLLHWRTYSSACKEESLVLGVCLISLLPPQLSIICFVLFLSFFFEKKTVQYFSRVAMVYLLLCIVWKGDQAKQNRFWGGDQETWSEIAWVLDHKVQ